MQLPSTTAILVSSARTALEAEGDTWEGRASKAWGEPAEEGVPAVNAEWAVQSSRLANSANAGHANLVTTSRCHLGRSERSLECARRVLSLALRHATLLAISVQHSRGLRLKPTRAGASTALPSGSMPSSQIGIERRAWRTSSLRPRCRSLSRRRMAWTSPRRVSCG